MKKNITNYTFNTSEKTITFNDYDNIEIEKILQISNVKTANIIYSPMDFGDSINRKGNASGNVLTLAYNTISMNNSDPLQIWYDDGVYNSYDLNNCLLTNDDNHFENPFGTKEGQLVVSEKENFWNRLLREGGRWAYGGSEKNVQAGIQAIVSAISPADYGIIQYPKSVYFCTTVNCYIVVGITTGIAFMPLLEPRIFVPANTTYEMKFDGEISLSYGTSIPSTSGVSFVVVPAADGHIAYSGYAVEITEND